MGPLRLPSVGQIYIDASGLIYSVERVEPYTSLLEPMWARARSGQFVIVSSDLIVLETLIKPLRGGDREIEDLYRSLFDSDELSLTPATRAMWEHAASLRAEFRLSTTDALHAATAMSAGCALFVTNDRDFLRVPSLPVVVLDDVAHE